jgi:hypothetical protein
MDASELSKIYNEIDKRETTQFDEKSKRNYHYLYIYPLFIAWISLLFWIYIRNVKGM